MGRHTDALQRFQALFNRADEHVHHPQQGQAAWVHPSPIAMEVTGIELLEAHPQVDEQESDPDK